MRTRQRPRAAQRDGASRGARYGPRARRAIRAGAAAGSTASDEPPAADELESLDLDAAVSAVERRMVLRALQASGDNKVEAARLLGVSERTLWYKLKKYRL